MNEPGKQATSDFACFRRAPAHPIKIAPGLPTDRLRIVDIYVQVEAARKALFSPAIVDFLSLVFERPPLLFQGLSFEKGSQQGMHQDTAYVVTSKPLELAAAWIALQDVTEGSGELMYYEGSHRLPEYRFSGEHKHWNPDRDPPAQHDEWASLIEANAGAMELQRRTFLPKKGDVLIWSADLAHGGSLVSDSEATRKSLVGHYCPIDVEPNFFSYLPERQAVRVYGEGYYASEYFDVNASDVSPIASTGHDVVSTPERSAARNGVRQWLRKRE